ncbi:alpha/beta fold hydrolase [Actinomadura rupiterrae]|uniref:alpha/beta fold hydrolase n=1 Tax=Actinomadura rupiterrae TaxID=559627 RepID=UPI0020A555BF|nr:alpha/beta hydrolase [Actinomadura rupiterrae]MCP2341416.1 pimeloyl-ACP methyl ester carboxylesterase [Actinomadura rupiterrae]
MNVLTRRRRNALAGMLVGAGLLAATLNGVLAAPAGRAAAADRPHTAPGPLPGFRDGYVSNHGIRIHYVVGGSGPALVLLHGWPETWYAWSGVMPSLAHHRTVIAIDLRGLGDSAPARSDAHAYEALTLATDVHAVVRHLGFTSAQVAGHDWGGNVAIAYAAEYRSEVSRLAVMEAPPTADYLKLVQQQPGHLWWDWFINGPQSGVAERLVNGDPRVFYSSIYKGALAPAAVNRYLASYGRPATTHAGFEYFRQQDEGEPKVDQLIAEHGKLAVPVLGVGGQRSMGTLVGQDMAHVATNTSTAVIPNADHWILDEQGATVLTLLSTFFNA